jgi:hypothetical protein
MAGSRKMRFFDFRVLTLVSYMAVTMSVVFADCTPRFKQIVPSNNMHKFLVLLEQTPHLSSLIQLKLIGG